MRIIEINRNDERSVTATVKLNYNETMLLANALYDYAQGQKLSEVKQEFRKNFYAMTELLRSGALDSFALDQINNMGHSCEEDLEESGRLIVLPCKPGSDVFVLDSRYTRCSAHDQEFHSCQVCESEECDSHREWYIHTEKSVSAKWIVGNLKQFGDTIFLTKEEAETARKECEESERQPKIMPAAGDSI